MTEQNKNTQATTTDEQANRTIAQSVELFNVQRLAEEVYQLQFTIEDNLYGNADDIYCDIKNTIRDIKTIDYARRDELAADLLDVADAIAEAQKQIELARVKAQRVAETYVDPDMAAPIATHYPEPNHTVSTTGPND